MVFTHNMGFWPQRYAAIVVFVVTLVLADSSLVVGQQDGDAPRQGGAGPGEVVAAAGARARRGAGPGRFDLPAEARAAGSRHGRDSRARDGRRYEFAGAPSAGSSDVARHAIGASEHDRRRRPIRVEGPAGGPLDDLRDQRRIRRAAVRPATSLRSGRADRAEGRTTVLGELHPVARIGDHRPRLGRVRRSDHRRARAGAAIADAARTPPTGADCEQRADRRHRLVQSVRSRAGRVLRRRKPAGGAAGLVGQSGRRMRPPTSPAPATWWTRSASR